MGKETVAVRVENNTPESLCPGGLTFEDCETAQALVEKVGGSRPNSFLDAVEGIRHWDNHAYLPVGCVACESVCTLSTESDGNGPTGRMQMLSRPHSVSASLV